MRYPVLDGCYLTCSVTSVREYKNKKGPLQFLKAANVVAVNSPEFWNSVLVCDIYVAVMHYFQL